MMREDRLDAGRSALHRAEKPPSFKRTVEFAHRVLQMEKTLWRNTLAGCSVIVYAHLDGASAWGMGLIWWAASAPREFLCRN